MLMCGGRVLCFRWKLDFKIKKNEGQHLPNVVHVLLYDQEKANLFQALCACAVTLKFHPSSRGVIFPNRELAHISRCDQLSHGRLHAYATAHLLFTWWNSRYEIYWRIRRSPEYFRGGSQLLVSFCSSSTATICCKSNDVCSLHSKNQVLQDGVCVMMG